MPKLRRLGILQVARLFRRQNMCFPDHASQCSVASRHAQAKRCPSHFGWNCMIGEDLSRQEEDITMRARLTCF
jgi:hypothetical protein